VKAYDNSFPSLCCAFSRSRFSFSCQRRLISAVYSRSFFESCSVAAWRHSYCHRSRFGPCMEGSSCPCEPTLSPSPGFQPRLLRRLGTRRDIETLATSTADVNSSTVMPFYYQHSLPTRYPRAIYTGSRVRVSSAHTRLSSLTKGVERPACQRTYSSYPGRSSLDRHS
jgi:hypothetical protein